MTERDAEAVGIAVVGPTATGKSELAVEVAERLGGEIVSVDSRQAYRGLEIGAAAPTPAQQTRVPHHGVSFLEPGERYSAGRFARLARGWIAAIRERGGVPVLAGGTGFFLSALTDPPFGEPPMEAGRRARLQAWLGDLTPRELRRWALRLDPGLSRELGTLDPQRCGRTIELALLSGRPVTWWQRHGEPEAPPLRFVAFALELPAREHRERIRRRAAALLDAGWTAEVERLLARGLSEDDPALSALGYAAVADLVQGRRGRAETLEVIDRETWRYARRQRTWFRHQLSTEAERLDARLPITELADRVVRAWNEARSAPGRPGAGREPSGEG